MTTGNTDVDIIASEPTPLTLVSGFEIKVERLRTRAVMSLLKILTKGAAEVLSSIVFSEEASQEEFTGQLVGAIILAIPEAEDETIEFVQRMVSPAGLRQGRSKEDAEYNASLIIELQEQLDDPELEDLLTIVTEIAKVEAPHLKALGNQLGVLFKAQRTSEVAKQSASSKRSTKNSTRTGS